MQNFPKGTRIVHRKLLQWGEVRVGDVDGNALENSSNYTEEHIVEKVSFGIPREPDDFVKEAIRAGQAALHRSLKPHCAAVLKGKRLLLFGEMPREISYPDVHLIQDICEGFRINYWLVA